MPRSDGRSDGSDIIMIKIIAGSRRWKGIGRGRGRRRGRGRERCCRAIRLFCASQHQAPIIVLQKTGTIPKLLVPSLMLMLL